MARTRYAELDILRGIAVMGMILFHFLFDLNFFGLFSIELNSGPWFWFARSIAFLFVFLAGLSCVLFSHRKGEGSYSLLRERGIRIFLAGMGVTLVTFLLFPEYTIWFGVLHLMGVGLFIAPSLFSRMHYTLPLGVILVGIGILFSHSSFLGIIPQWVGVFPFPFRTFDYFPLFPWLGVFFLGMGFSTRMYPHGVPRPGLGWETDSVILRGLQWMGRRSLIIYLVHQPILLFLVWAWLGGKIPL
ncbi:MAG: heparan-alpha-glucosaminide N-acetyltransferase [archaeon]|mgnify:CR=1 FL=1